MGDGSADGAVSRGMVAQEAGDFETAEKLYRRALEQNPKQPAVLNNLAVLVARRGDKAAALNLLDGLVSEQPGYVSAHLNRANVLLALERTEDAIAVFREVIALEPDHVDAHRALAIQWLALGDRDRSLDHFARIYELRRGEGRIGIAEKSLRTTSVAKLAHDSDLFRHLPSRARDGQRFKTLARLYDSVGQNLAEGVVELTEDQLDMLGPDYNTALHYIDAPEILSGAVRRDMEVDAIQALWRGSGSGVATIDNLLTEKALNLLKRHLAQSTIWHDFSHIDGFVATYLEDGFACPLVLQIADEFRAALPELLGARPLKQAWAFKALTGDRVIDIHADDAAISLNFWVTPDTANRNPDTGGLIVYQTPPPSDWTILDYDADRARIADFLADNVDSAAIVPYRENRGVLFDSRLFHGTDRPNFRAGYENHRINITLLYGNCG